MNDHAIQRWYFDRSERRSYDSVPTKIPLGAPIPAWCGVTWCRSKDVETLEELIISYLATIRELRAKVAALTPSVGDTEACDNLEGDEFDDYVALNVIQP